MIIKREGFLGLGVDYTKPSPQMGSQSRRAYHTLWMAEFRWHHVLRHWLFGGYRPLPLCKPNSLSNVLCQSALWRRVAKDIYWGWQRTAKSEDWGEFNNWFNSLPEAPEPGESSVVFVDKQGKWEFVAKISREGILKWLK